MTAASDAESADEMTSPVKKSRKRLVDSDDDDEDFTPGVLQMHSATNCCFAGAF